MKFALVGATGGSGLCIVRQALDGGHEVTAIVRNKAKLEDIQHDNFKVSSTSDCRYSERTRTVKVPGALAVVTIPYIM